MDWSKLEADLQTREATRTDIEAIRRNVAIVRLALGSNGDGVDSQQCLMNAIAWLAICNVRLLDELLKANRHQPWPTVIAEGLKMTELVERMGIPAHTVGSSLNPQTATALLAGFTPPVEQRCTCHERDSSFVCPKCYAEGARGHCQQDEASIADEFEAARHGL